MPKPLIVADLQFPSQVAAIAHFMAILNAAKHDETIDKVHWPALNALLHSRPVKVAELNGRKVVGFVRARQPAQIAKPHWTSGFWALLDDEQRLDFHLRNSIKALADAHAQPAD